MNWWMDPESEISNISQDIQQNSGFRGACGEGVFFCDRCPGDCHDDDDDDEAQKLQRPDLPSYS